jgi:hypothetical protein
MEARGAGHRAAQERIEAVPLDEFAFVVGLPQVGVEGQRGDAAGELVDRAGHYRL